LEGEKMEVMGLGMCGGISFICVLGNSVTIHFPRKKMHFCFNHPLDPDAGSSSQKVWRFKRFINLIRTVTYLKYKKKYWHDCPIVISTVVPDRHLLERNAQSAVNMK
jgi:hypothetical protein